MDSFEKKRNAFEQTEVELDYLLLRFGGMYSFSKTSEKRLFTCHHDLQRLAVTVARKWNCTVICGRRSKEEQKLAFDGGFSKVHWPNSLHNVINPDDLSNAIDLAPYDKTIRNIPWDDTLRFIEFGFFVKGVALGLGINLGWGADWDNDYETEDEKWRDWPHFFRRGT